MKIFREMNKVTKFFVAALVLGGAVTLLDVSINLVHAKGGKTSIKR